MFGGRSDNTDDTAAAATEIWESSGLWNSHFKATGTVTSPGVLALHYHKGGLVASTYDIDETRAPLAPPATNPFVSAAGFMPTFATRPFAKGASVHASLFKSAAVIMNPMWCLVANAEVPFVAMYVNQASNRHVRYPMVCGDIIVPRAAGDIYSEGTYSADIADHFVITADDVQILDEAGAQEEVASVASYDAMDEFNQPRADGAYDRDPIPLGSEKGYLDEDVIAIQGWYGSHRNRLFTSDYGAAVKLTDRMVFPWEPDVLPPFIGWPIDAQVIPASETQTSAVLLDTLRADAGLGLGDGAPVVTWTGVGVGAIWTATGGPIYRATAAANGLPSVEFVPTDYVTEDGALGVLNTPTSYVFVLQIKTATATKYVFDGVTKPQRAIIISGNTWGIGASTSSANTAVAASTGLQVIIVVFNGKRSFIEIDGIPSGFVSALDSAMELMRIGANLSGTSGMDAYLHECQVWKGAMTSAQRVAVRASAQTDWSAP